MEESNINKIAKILVTGTKGKTTICTILNHIIITAGKSSILVDTLGCHYNNKVVATYDDSIRNVGKSPNVMPGRYIYWNLLHTEDKLENIYAVLEAGIACWKWGTGLQTHDAGIFTNVYRDHLDFKKIKTERDIYKRKSFIFKQLRPGGTYIASLDDKFTLGSFKEKFLKTNKIKTIGVTTKIEDTDTLKKMKRELSLSDILFVKADWACSLSDGKLYDLKNYRYFFNGANEVMIQNLLFALAYTSKIFELSVIKKAVDSYLLPEEYGRFLIYKKGNKHVVIDYAHEPQSLIKLVENINSFISDTPYLITRLAQDRNNDFIADFAHDISEITNITGLTIFDKVDGKKSKIYRGRGISRGIGESSSVLKAELEKLSPSYKFKVILNEADALEEAIKKGHDLIIEIFSDLDSVLKIIKKHKYERII